jgi:hypothetical protein
MRNTAEVTGGKPIAVLLYSISGVSAINQNKKKILNIKRFVVLLCSKHLRINSEAREVILLRKTNDMAVGIRAYRKFAVCMRF